MKHYLLVFHAMPVFMLSHACYCHDTTSQQEAIMDINSTEQSGIFSAAFSGRFTFNDNQNFRQFLNQIENSQTVHTIRLECEKIEFIDSAALGMLLILHDMAMGKGVRVMLCGAQGQFQRMIEISKFDLLFTIEPLMRHG